MRLRITLCVGVLFAGVCLFAQNSGWCGTDQKLKEILQNDPTAAARLQQNWKDVEDYINASSQRAEGDLIITIPVVVHVIYVTGQAIGVGSNIPDSQILSQIPVLNECFRRQNPDRVMVTDTAFIRRIADVQIEFCLASFAPDGSPTSGITRHPYSSIGNFDNEVKPATSWPSAQYLNIWTTTLNGQILGYATFPNMVAANQDGVVLDYRHIGKAPANPHPAPNNLGKTCVHEVGHWLGLYHTFQDSCSGMDPATCKIAGDRICDTPPAKEASYGTPNLLQNTCHESPVDENDMWMNFMDYVDDKNLNMFTMGQREAMRGVINTNRLSIQSGMGCTDTTTAFQYSGKVVDATTNQPVPGAKVLFNGARDFEVTTDANGDFAITGLFNGYYNVYAGKWGYRTTFFANHQEYAPASAAVTIPIQDHHYYDDFLFNYGWTANSTASSGAWVRAVPVGSFHGAEPANPTFDVYEDYGLKAYLTGNGSTVATAGDVDNGKVTLISPVFDLSTYTDPYIQYYRWFYDGNEGAGPGDDNMVFKLNDGANQVTLETITVSENKWAQKSFRIKDNAGIQLTANMRLIVEVSDLATGTSNIVEGALDKFEVLEADKVGVTEPQTVSNLLVYPNPTTAILNVAFKAGGNTRVRVLNLVGQEISARETTAAGNQHLQFDLSTQPAGLYFISIRSGNFEKNVKFSLAR